jgi:hypothetical protein
MIIINFCPNPLGFDHLFTHDRDLHEIKVMYDHNRIASYRHLCVGNVGGEYRYWLLKGNERCSAGGFPSNPFCPGPRRTVKNILELEYGGPPVPLYEGLSKEHP